MLRPLLHYFLIGGLLFSAKAAYEGRRVEGPEITVRVSSDATRIEVERAVREAILLNEARRYGWDRHDPVVFSHLIRNMRFIEPDSTADDATLYKRALDMNMHRHDPIVRARLLYRAEEALGYVAGYTIANDVGSRDLEARSSQWISGKILDTFCPMGPALVSQFAKKLSRFTAGKLT